MLLEKIQKMTLQHLYYQNRSNFLFKVPIKTAKYVYESWILGEYLYSSRMPEDINETNKKCDYRMRF